MRTLRSVYADIDPATQHGVVITEDVVSQGGTFLDGNSPYTPDQTAQTLAEFARLHAATWADPRYADVQWLAPRLGRVLEVWGVSTTIDIIGRNFDGPNGQGIPDEVRDAHRLVDAYRSLAAQRRRPEPGVSSTVMPTWAISFSTPAGQRPWSTGNSSNAACGTSTSATTSPRH